MTNLDTLLARLSEAVPSEDALQERLDDLIHDEYSRMASDLNNEGPNAQLALLITSGMTADEIVDNVKEPTYG